MSNRIVFMCILSVGALILGIGLTQLLQQRDCPADDDGISRAPEPVESLAPPERKGNLVFLPSEREDVDFIVRDMGRAILLSDAGATVHAYAGANLASVRIRPQGGGLLLSYEKHSASIYRGPELLQGAANVTYETAIPGIRQVYYAQKSALAFDIEVAPYADLDQARWDMEGVEVLTIDDNGRLLGHLDDGSIVSLSQPIAFQRGEDNKWQKISCSYMTEGTSFSFVMGEDYDPSRSLIIDPTVTLASYFGGSNEEREPVMALAMDGKVLLGGATKSSDFPVTPGVSQEEYAGGSYDGFVSCFDSTGTVLLWSTYLGGSGLDVVRGIAVSPDNRVFVGATTSSDDFPMVWRNNARWCGVISEINPSGQQIYAWTFEGTGHLDITDMGFGVDSEGRYRLWITGTTSGNIQLVNAQDSTRRGDDGYLAGFDVTTLPETLFHSTYLSASSTVANSSLGVSSDGWVGVGLTYGASAARHPLDASPGERFGSGGGPFDLAMALFNSTGGLEWVRLVGGSDQEYLRGIALSDDHELYAVGDVFGDPSTAHPMPVTPGAFTDIPEGEYYGSAHPGHPFVLRLSAEDGSVLGSSRLARSGSTSRGMAIDVGDDIVVVGGSLFDHIPSIQTIINPIQGVAGTNGVQNGYIVALSRDLSTAHVSSYFATGSNDSVWEVALNGDEDLWVVGQIDDARIGSQGLPITDGSFQPNYAGGGDVYLARIDLTIPETPELRISAQSQNIRYSWMGTDADFNTNTMTITRTGGNLDQPLSVALAITEGDISVNGVHWGVYTGVANNQGEPLSSLLTFAPGQSVLSFPLTGIYNTPYITGNGNLPISISILPSTSYVAYQPTLSLQLVTGSGSPNRRLGIRAQHEGIYENGTPGIFEVQSDIFGTPMSNFDVHYAISGTAHNGVDYELLSGIARWGSDTQTGPRITIYPIDNDVLDGTRSVTLTILPDPAGVYQINEHQASATMLIYDDEDPPLPKVRLHVIETEAHEGGQNARFAVVRYGPTGTDFSEPLSVRLTYGGTATSGLDYIPLPTHIIIPAGQVSTQFELEAIDDDIVEGPETVTVTVVNQDHYERGSPHSITLTIVDNDVAELPVIGITPGMTPVESGGSSSFTISRIGGDLTEPLQVHLNPPAGSAVEGEHYSTAMPETVTIPANHTSASIDVSTLVFTGSNRSLILSIDPRDHYEINGSTATIIITGDDEDPLMPGILSFVHGQLDVTPGSTLVVGVQRSDGEDGEVGVQLSSSDGTAIAGDDYTAVSRQLIWENGDSGNRQTNIVIPAGATPDRSFTLSLTDPSGGAEIGGIDTITIYIIAGESVAVPRVIRLRVEGRDVWFEVDPDEGIDRDQEDGYEVFMGGLRNLDYRFILTPYSGG